LVKEPENTGNIVLPEGNDDRIIMAAARLIEDVWLTFRSLATRNK
jgi:phosphotransacetylase